MMTETYCSSIDCGFLQGDDKLAVAIVRQQEGGD